VPLRLPVDAHTAWPRSAQLATVFLLGAAIALLAVHAYGYSRWGSRPTDLSRGISPPHRVDLNQADHAELLQLPGVGENLARRIESHRRENGGFRSVDELRAIHGIGPTTLERLRPWVRVSLDRNADEQAALDPHQVTNSKKSRTGTQGVVGKKEAALTSVIDLNRATLADLQRLPGIGPSRARDIIEERRNKPFQSVDDLTRVRGIKAKTLEKVRPFITVDTNSLHVAAAESAAN
jgi:competence protein ComEA